MGSWPHLNTRGSLEKSRQLRKAETQSKVCITFSDSPNSPSVQMRLCKHGNVLCLDVVSGNATVRSLKKHSSRKKMTCLRRSGGVVKRTLMNRITALLRTKYRSAFFFYRTCFCLVRGNHSGMMYCNVLKINYCVCIPHTTSPPPPTPSPTPTPTPPTHHHLRKKKEKETVRSAVEIANRPYSRWPPCWICYYHAN